MASPDVRYVLVFVLFAATLAGCSQTRPGSTSALQAPTMSTAPHAPQATAAIPAEIQQVCSDFTAAALAFDTTRDQGPAQARQRAAARFGTAELEARVGAEAPSAMWATAAAHRGRVEITVTPVRDDPPTPREDRAAAGAVAKRVAVGDDGWRQDLSTVVTYCSLRREAEGWRVVEVRLADADSGAGSP
jgi:hypothetical protein